MEQSTKPAPIALFVYNRLDHVTKTIESLKENALAKESWLYVFSDGAKNPEGGAAVAAVRKYIHTIDGFAGVTIVEREKNFGLAQSIIRGVTETIEKTGRIIVVEDDLIFSPYFLKYMNDALELYADESKVMNINGYLLPVSKKHALPETFFLTFISPLGWGTWKRAWDTFRSNDRELLDEIKKRNAEYRFNIDGSYPLLHHLKANIIGRWNTWAIKWYASIFLSGGLGLFPGTSLVRHIGFDEEATHAKLAEGPLVEISEKPLEVKKIELTESAFARGVLRDYFLHLEKSATKRYYKLFKENLKRIVLIKRLFDFLRTKLYNERNAI